MESRPQNPEFRKNQKKNKFTRKYTTGFVSTLDKGTNQNNSVAVVPCNGCLIKPSLTQTGDNIVILHKICQIPLKEYIIISQI